MRYSGKEWQAGQATDDNMTRGNCILDIQDHR